jgi:hypothetical protein
MAILASVALAQARTLLNDDSANVWTDTALLPKLDIAHRELQSLLWERGSPVLREESSIILVDIAATTLTTNQPVDLLAPIKLFEYDWATGPVYTNPVEMTEVIYIPKGLTVTTKLLYWAWREEVIVFQASSAKRGVVVQYRKWITPPALASTDMAIMSSDLYIGPRTAALAAMSVGNETIHKIYTQMAMAAVERVIAANRGQQTSLGSA